VFTDSPLTMLQAEHCHRGHAIVEQVIADLKNGPLAHLPSGSFAANGAWLGRDRVQPHPRRRLPRLPVPRQGDHGHDPSPTDQPPRPARPIRPPARHPSPDRLALGTPLDRSVHPDLRTTTSRDLTTQPEGPRPENHRGNAGQTGSNHTPTRANLTIKINYRRPQRRSVDSG